MLCHGVAEQGVQLAHQRAQAAHVVLVELGHVGTTTRQDGHQMAAFEDQQRLAHRTTADIQRLGNLLLLDTFGRLELAADDPLGQVMGNLLGEAVRRLERHGFPSKSLNCAQAPNCSALAPAPRSGHIAEVGTIGAKDSDPTEPTMLITEHL
ncbi:hypothetical protein D3C80_1436880 [compost metagenome]